MDELERLNEVLRIYKPVVDFYVGTSSQAKRVRRRIPKDSQCETRFHSNIHAYFEQLLSTTSDWHRDGDRKAASRLLRLLESSRLIRYGGRSKADMLERLQTAGRSEKTAIFRLATPSIDVQKKLENRLRKCVEALKANDISPAILPMVQNNREWRQARHICEGLLALRHSLEGRIGHRAHCRCKRTHKAVFSFSFPCGTPGELARYRLHYQHRPDLWRVADIHGVGFGPKDKHSNDSGRQYQQHDHFCDLFLKNKGRLSVSLGQRGFRIHTPESSHIRMGSMNMISLRSSTAKQTLLAELQNAEEIDRVYLALLLSYAYLYLSGSPWWPDTTIDPDMWFLAAEENSNRRWRQPFLLFDPETSDPSCPRMEWLLNGKRPSLPAFGKFLLEIWTGKELDLGTGAMQEAEKICRRTIVGRSVYRLSRTCLRGDPELQYQGSLDSLPQLRSKFVHEVVCVLQYWLSLDVNGAENTGSRINAAGDAGIHRAMHHLMGQLSSPLQIDSEELFEECTSDSSDHEVLAGAVANELKPKGWLDRIRREVHPFIRALRPSGDTLKVAIIDTGVLFNSRQRVTEFHEKVREYRSWCCNGESDGVSGLQEDGVPAPNFQDKNGHGTHIASTLHQIAPDCDLYIAQVFGKERLGRRKPNTEMFRRISQAIEYARKEWRVNIISLSFGFHHRVDSIHHAIEKATRHGILVFAAAHNDGANEPVAWPASHDRVISVHATDANGNPYLGNPNPSRQPSQFATLGCDVPAFGLDGPETVRSGTSVATPIAAGIAALVIDLMQRASINCQAQGSDDERDYFTEQIPKLMTCSGMTKVLQLLVDAAEPSPMRERYLAPWHKLCHSKSSHSFAIESILRALQASG